MKFRLRIRKRTNVYIAIVACVSAIGMMVVRFQFPLAKVLEILWITLFFLTMILLLAAGLGYLIRFISEKRNQ